MTPIEAVHAGALISIVQCLASTNDVLSLLQALPRHALDASLAALETLLMSPSDFLNQHWPHVCIELMDYHNGATVLTALPTFRSIRIHHLGGLDEELRDLSHNEPEPIVAFAAKWGHKIASIDVTSWLEVRYNTALARVLGLCTGLVSLAATVTIELDPNFLAAVVHAARHAKRIDCTYFGGQPYPCGDWRLHFATWLGSGHATHLGLTGFSSTDNNGFAQAIAATTSLTSLKLNNTDDVLQGLVDAAMSLYRLTELRLFTCRRDVVEVLLSTFIDPSRLRVLDLGLGGQDLAIALKTLPRFVRLEELSLRNVILEGVSDVPPAPTNLRVLNIYRCSMDDGAFSSLLSWTSQSPCLETVSIGRCPIAGVKVVYLGRYLRQWIAAGVQNVALIECALDEKSIIAIAMTLCDAHRTHQLFALSFGRQELSLESGEVLVEALATCTGVRVDEVYLRHQHTTRLEARAATLRVRLEHVGRGLLHLRGPLS